MIASAFPAVQGSCNLLGFRKCGLKNCPESDSSWSRSGRHPGRPAGLAGGGGVETGCQLAREGCSQLCGTLELSFC